VERDVVARPQAQPELAEATTVRRHLKMQVEEQAAALPYPQEPFAVAVVEVPKAEALRWRLSRRRQEMSARARSS
jgi:hypothetical protein